MRILQFFFSIPCKQQQYQEKQTHFRSDSNAFYLYIQRLAFLMPIQRNMHEINETINLHIDRIGTYIKIKLNFSLKNYKFQKYVKNEHKIIYFLQFHIVEIRA